MRHIKNDHFFGDSWIWSSWEGQDRDRSHITKMMTETAKSRIGVQNQVLFGVSTRPEPMILCCWMPCTPQQTTRGSVGTVPIDFCGPSDPQLMKHGPMMFLDHPRCRNPMKSGRTQPYLLAPEMNRLSLRGAPKFVRPPKINTVQ